MRRTNLVTWDSDVADVVTAAGEPVNRTSPENGSGGEVLDFK